MWSETQLKDLKNEYLASDQGIQHCNNSHHLYFKLLNRFTNGQKNFISQFNQALLLFRQTNVSTVQETMIRMAHTLKGNAATLGAKQLHNIAAELELKSSENAVVDDLVMRVDTVLMHTMDDIDKLIAMSELNIEKDKEKTNISYQDCLQIISETKVLLKGFDTEAIDKIQQLLTYNIDEQHLRFLEQALIALDQYDFSSALLFMDKIELKEK